jgi:PAS domain S-box-containing protein
MSQNKIDILQRALNREKAARKQAEKILEEKSSELYLANNKLERLNIDLESLLNRTDSQLQGVFENIIDAYVIMDLSGNILKMNKSAVKLLELENDKVDYNLNRMVYPNDYVKVAKSYKELIKDGFLTNFEINLKTKGNKAKMAHINASIIYDKGIAVAAQGIIRDITATKENELISEVINNITQTLLGKTDIYEVASVIIEKIASYLKTTDCVIYTVNHAENSVEQIASTGSKIDINGNLVNKLNIDIGYGIVGTVAKTGQSELIPDTSKDNRYIVDIQSNYSELTVPIIIEDQVIAVIDSEHPNKNHFTKDQLRTIENIAGIIGIKIKNAISLKEQERFQNKLLKSEERLRILISSLETGMLLEDEERKIVLTNSKFCQIFNISILPKDMIGADCIDAAEESKHYFKDPEKFVDRINVILLKKEAVLADELIMVNGKILERDYIPLFADNKYTGHLWSYRDVTLQRNYRRSIEAQRQKYRRIIANMNLGLLEVNNHDEIMMANQGFSKMSGYSEKELLGKRANEVLLDQKTIRTFQRQSQRRLKGGSNLYEIVVKNKKGEPKTWLISGAPNYNLAGELIGSIGIHLDITIQKKLQLEKENLVDVLKKKNKELQEYAQIVSHDLKSPLRNISALTTWIKEDNLTTLNKTTLEHFGHLEQTLERMEDLISGILKYSSINHDKSKQNMQVDLNKTVSEIIQTLHIPKHINITINKKLPLITGEETKFQQLFQNLLNNAVTHIDKEKGYVEIGFKIKKEEYEFYVKDNGVGIDKKYHEQIFEIFYYITKNKNSSGIGLSIVKKIVEIYGGKIWVDSELERGTTFYFTIKK